MLCRDAAAASRRGRSGVRTTRRAGFAGEPFRPAGAAFRPAEEVLTVVRAGAFFAGARFGAPSRRGHGPSQPSEPTSASARAAAAKRSPRSPYSEN